MLEEREPRGFDVQGTSGRVKVAPGFGRGCGYHPLLSIESHSDSPVKCLFGETRTDHLGVELSPSQGILFSPWLCQVLPSLQPARLGGKDELFFPLNTLRIL